MRVFIISSFLVLSAVASAQVLNTKDVLEMEWKAYKAEHGKMYRDFEDGLRQKMYLQSRKKVAEHNIRFEMGLESYQMGINQYSDKLSHERQHRECLSYSGNITDAVSAAAPVFLPPANVRLPDTVDWRKHGAVTAVKDQGDCGSCWAFSSTGSLEGQHFRKAGKMVSLSEENLVDCVYDRNGCEGGLMSDAYKYISINRGIDTENSYPYTAGKAGEDEKCHFQPVDIGATDIGFTMINQGDEDALKAAVATVGPIAVAIDAEVDFQLYKGGVFHSDSCSTTSLDHGVLVAGYGTDEETGMDYWLVKNSWGANWGEDGYIRMARNKDNMCGIATFALYPNV